VYGTVPPTPYRVTPLPVGVWTVDRGPATPTPLLLKNLATAIQTLMFFELTFNSSFPLPKTDLVYVPVFPTGASK